MIPALVADEIRETLLDYLRTTWALSDHGLEQALFPFLETGQGHGEVVELPIRSPGASLLCPKWTLSAFSGTEVADDRL